MYTSYIKIHVRDWIGQPVT